MAPHLPALLRPDLRLDDSPSPPETYDEALERAFCSLGLQVPPFKTEEQKQQEVLDILASGGLEALQNLPAELQGLPLCEALLKRSWALRHDDPAQMVQLARAATLLADRLEAKELSVKARLGLRCRAWAELANAYRVADQLDLAEEALGRGMELGLLIEDALLDARLFDIQASLYADRRFFDQAGNLLDILAALYRRQGDAHLEGRALISKGIYIGYQGELTEAVRLLQQGLSLVDDSRDPGVAYSALQAQARFLADAGFYKDAMIALWNLKQRKPYISGRISDLKIRWMEGQIYVGLKQFDRAERDLKYAKQGFEEAGLGYKAALAGLELGAVWLHQGRLEEAEGIVRECVKAFLSLGIRRELLASIRVLQKAVETRYLSLATLQHVIDLLHKAERNPKASPPEEP